MGAKIERRLLALIAIFVCTGILVYSQSRTEPIGKKPPLKQFLGEIPGYTTIRANKLEDNAFDMLKLDDYLFTSYAGKDGQVTLYVGYYYSASKAYAAHSPLVCYPSQGWQISKEPTIHKLKIGDHTITYEEIVTSFGEERDLVLYWLQARERANTQVYRNKIDMGYNKLFHNDPHHGFIRVSVPFAGSASYEETKKKAIDFIKIFYPFLLNYTTYPSQT